MLKILIQGSCTQHGGSCCGSRSKRASASNPNVRQEEKRWPGLKCSVQEGQALTQVRRKLLPLCVWLLNKRTPEDAILTNHPGPFAYKNNGYVALWSHVPTSGSRQVKHRLAVGFPLLTVFSLRGNENSDVGDLLHGADKQRKVLTKLRSRHQGWNPEFPTYQLGDFATFSFLSLNVIICTMKLTKRTCIFWVKWVKTFNEWTNAWFITKLFDLNCYYCNFFQGFELLPLKPEKGYRLKTGLF